MTNVLDQTIGLVPVALATYIAVRTIDQIKGPGQKQGKSKTEWNEISQKEITKFIGKRKSDLVRENSGQIFQFGKDKFMYEKGKYYLS